MSITTFKRNGWNEWAHGFDYFVDGWRRGYVVQTPHDADRFDLFLHKPNNNIVELDRNLPIADAMSQVEEVVRNA